MRLIGVLILVVAALSACGGAPKPSRSAPVNVAVIGDSYTTQPPPWPEAVSRVLGVPIAVAGEGGSGYTNPGVKGTVFRQRISEIVRPNVTLIIFFGSRNDRFASADQLANAARTTYTEARLIAPEARILAVGPIWPEGDPPTAVLQTRDVLRGQALAEGISFVDPIAEGWLTAPGLVKDDKVHPNAAGNQFLAEKMAYIIRQVAEIEHEPAPTGGRHYSYSP